MNNIKNLIIGITSLIFIFLTQSKTLFLIHSGVLIGVIISVFIEKLRNKALTSMALDLYLGKQTVWKHSKLATITSTIIQILNLSVFLLFVYSLILEYQQFR